MPEPVTARHPLPTGLSYHVLEWAPADPACDHTVVLLHGFLDSAWTWEPVVEAGLAGRFHVVAPDLRGHGDSDRVGPGGYYHFFDYLADLHGLLPRVRRARLSLVGHSMGGLVAGLYAGTFPDGLHRLAVLEGLGLPEHDDTGPERTAAWIEGWIAARNTAPRPLEDLADAAARLMRRDPRLSGEEALRVARHGTRRVHPHHDRAGLAWKHDPLHLTRGPYVFRRVVVERTWARIACPVLLVDGAESEPVLPQEEAAARRALFPRARHVVLPGAAHMMQRHQPASLAQLLAGFLTE